MYKDFILILILCLIIMLQNITHYFERRDLCNRIMSRNLKEYKSEKVQSSVSAHKRVLDRWKDKGGES